MGRRAFRRSVSDASLGRFTLLLGYKAERSGTRIVRADRFFASSQIHHGCGCRLVAPTGVPQVPTGRLRPVREIHRSLCNGYLSFIQPV